MPTLTWTQDDLDKLKAAVGGGVLEVEYEGPPKRRIRYQSLAEMRDLLTAMAGAVAAASGQGSYRLAATKKGL